MWFPSKRRSQIRTQDPRSRPVPYKIQLSAKMAAQRRGRCSLRIQNQTETAFRKRKSGVITTFPMSLNRLSKTEEGNFRPGTYARCARQCRRSRFDYNFGRPKRIDCVEEFCIPKPVDTCNKCTELCQGDYWHINYAEFLCQICMTEEKALHEMYSVEQLKLFKVI